MWALALFAFEAEVVIEDGDLSKHLSPPQLLALAASGNLPAPIHRALLVSYHAALRVSVKNTTLP
jgi:hypothetical protein